MCLINGHVGSIMCLIKGHWEYRVWLCLIKGRVGRHGEYKGV